MLRAAESSRSVACSGTTKRPAQQMAPLSAARRVRAFVAALRGKCREFLSDLSDFIAGEVSGEMVDGRPHDLCRQIHVEGACPRQLIGVCDVCGPVDLTCDQENYGGCPNSGPHGGLVHYVQQRRAKPRRTPLREVKAID